MSSWALMSPILVAAHLCRSRIKALSMSSNRRSGFEGLAGRTHESSKVVSKSSNFGQNDSKWNLALWRKSTFVSSHRGGMVGDVSTQAP